MNGTSMWAARGGLVRILAALVVPVVLVGLVAGCGSEESEGPADPVAATTTPPATASAAATASGLKASRLAMFRMPSGNIGCAIDDAGVVCGVRNASFTPPPRPKVCEGDWGQTLTIDPKQARFVCAGDTPLEPDAPVLAYGSENRVDGYVCTSSKESLRCEHTRSGRGFTLSRSSYRLF